MAFGLASAHDLARPQGRKKCAILLERSTPTLQRWWWWRKSNTFVLYLTHNLRYQKQV